MSSKSPKTVPEEKMERHFNGIIMTVLAIIAAALLLATLLFYKTGSKVVPATRPQRAPDTHSPQ